MTYECTVLDSNERLRVEPPDDRWNVKVVELREFARAEPMVAVIAGSMVPHAQRDH